MANRSSFPNQIDTFIELFDLPDSERDNADRLRELMIKKNRTDAEDAELNRLRIRLNKWFLSPETWNFFCDCLKNMEEFLKSEWQEYFMYYDSFDINKTYKIFNTVKYGTGTYILYNTEGYHAGVLPIDTTCWRLQAMVGANADIKELRRLITLSDSTLSNIVFVDTSSDIKTFNKDTDNLTVILNKQTELINGLDYIINSDNKSVDILNSICKVGDTLYFKVLKNVQNKITTADGAMITPKTITKDKLSDEVQLILEHAETAYNNSNELLKSIIIKDLTILSANWVDDTANSGYWKYIYSDTDIKAVSVCDVNISIGSINNAKNVMSTNDSSNGFLTLYAKAKPLHDLTATLKIIKEGVA